MNAILAMPTGASRKGEEAFERRLELVMGSVDLYHTHLQDYLHRLTQQWQDAEDLMQELWRYVLLHFPEEKIQTLSLLRRKAYQLFIDHYRAAKRRPEVLTDELPETPVSHAKEASFSPESESALSERFWQDFGGIDLTEAQKNVLWLHGRYGLTYQEIEKRTGIPNSTVGDWIALGRERLADFLNNEK